MIRICEDQFIAIHTEGEKVKHRNQRNGQGYIYSQEKLRKKVFKTIVLIFAVSFVPSCSLKALEF